MNLAFNPKDTNTFASSCLDRTVKMWSLGTSTPNFTLEAHEKGVNFVDFYPGSDKPYLVTSSDDRSIKVWDYLSKSCVQTMEGHTNNVSFVKFHPNLPLLISGSEDGIRQDLEQRHVQAREHAQLRSRARLVYFYPPNGNDVAFGYDEGLVVIKVRQLISHRHCHY